MLGKVLEFAPGTTEACERLVTQLFQQPQDVLDAYRRARRQFRTSDIVLVTAERDPSGFQAMTRTHYVERIRRGLSGRGGDKLLGVLSVGHQSAHQIAKLPADSEAMWLIINRKDAMPVMVVLFTAPYATGSDAREPTILRN